MLLALDIGNTAVKGGLFSDETLVRVFSVEPPPDEDGASGGSHWHKAFAAALGEATVEHVGIASVVPARTDTITNLLRDLTGASVTAVHPEMQLPLTLDYDTPDTLGTDRLAAAAAGWVRYGRTGPQSVLVVDAGTAVNYEVVHRDGIYRGGAIGPGPALMQKALRGGTAQLPDIPLHLPKSPTGTSTQTALQSGVLWGLIDSVHGMTRRLAAPLPDAPQLLLTGGWSEALTEHLDADVERDRHLVLRGVRLLTAMNR